MSEQKNSKSSTPKQNDTTKKVKTVTQKSTAQTKPNKTTTTTKKSGATAKKTSTKKEVEEEKSILDEDYEEKNFLQKIWSKIYKKKEEEKVIERFNPSISYGLNSEQIRQREREGYVNNTEKKYSKSYASIFLENLLTFFNLLCILCAIFLIIAKAPVTQLFFVIIFAINIFIGIVQEIKAKHKIDKLSLLTSPNAKVVRNGEEKEIEISKIVLDDIIILKTGQQIPVDCIVKEGYIEVNESLLTGEAVPIKKEAGEKLLAGSFISSGTCKVIAEKVGKHTYLQSLSARASRYKKPKSELLNATRSIIRVVGVLIPLICLGMAFINWNNYVPQEGITQMQYTIQRTASVAIGMIPAGMMLLTSLALAAGVIKLTRYNTLVQDLYSLEMLARVNVLCLDKTGTITDGRMEVTGFIPLEDTKETEIKKVVPLILGTINDNNQTSIALFNYFGMSSQQNATKIVPFSSKRKYSAVTFPNRGTYALGAPEFVMPNMSKEIFDEVDKYASQGLRVLLIAHSEKEIIGEDKLPNDMKPKCLITLVDNIREDAIETINWFKENDVDIKIISGDNPITVAEVARRVGVRNADKFISLEGLNEKEVINIANKYTVFGRVTPEQKAILVKSIKSAGNTVAMTGDGVNDILALKEADCAISVASGSEAARNVSNLVLMDDNFNSMPMVVNEGRRVINNVKKSSALFLMKTIFVALLSLSSIILQKSYPFTTDNMLMLEFFIIGIPSFFLSLQPNNDRVSGNFLGYVLTRAIPGALILLFGIVIIELGAVISPDLFLPYKNQMNLLVFSFCGLVMLYRFCQPVNISRVILLVASILLCVGTVIAQEFLKNTDLDLLVKHGTWVSLPWSHYWFLLCIIQTAIPLSKWLIMGIEKIGNEIMKRRQIEILTKKEKNEESTSTENIEVTTETTHNNS